MVGRRNNSSMEISRLRRVRESGLHSNKEQRAAAEVEKIVVDTDLG